MTAESSFDADGGTVRVLVVGERDAPGALTGDGMAVEAASGADAALDALVSGGVDCVVGVHDPPRTDALALLEAVREDRPDVPFVLLAREGSEALAADAVAADATEYVPGGADGERLRASVRRAVRRGRATGRRRRRADQFEATFADPETVVGVLDPEGRLVRANRAMLDVLDADAEAVVGRRLWNLPWGDGGDADRLRERVERAAGGERVSFEAGLRASGRPGLVLDVAIRPTTGTDGEVTSLVVEGTDVTERRELEEELRESEELHRVTLANMTDTVLITDDDGRFTYVCPNVHFIFGYGVEEIHGMGTLDALLGDALFDRERLEREGVLTNIECTATDKAGREHVLLVNVRQVSIQGGTTLVSCRDITTRKQRERALTRLHRTSRELLYAETEREIGTRVVEDAADVLGLSAAAVYLFDSETSALRPVARTDAMESVHGPLVELAADGDSPVADAFVEGEARTFPDVHDAPGLSNPATDLRGMVCIPLDDHGVFVAGDTERDAFDDVTEEVADLLAATAEAALDRVERETELRERDRTLQQRNRELTELNRINDIIREIDQALVAAETREEIASAVCERMTAGDRFAFAWVSERDPVDGERRPLAWAGEESGYLDSVRLADGGDRPDAAEPTVRAGTTREAAHVPNVADDLRAAPWRKEALARGYQSALSVPLSYEAVPHGTLTVYATRPDAFDGTVREVLEELGDTIGSALSAVERKRALLGDPGTELEYEIADPGCVFHRLARRGDCTLALEGTVGESPEGVDAFVSVEGASPERFGEVAAESVAVADARAVATDGDGGLVRLRLTRPFLATLLADHGAVLREVRADGEAARARIGVPRNVEVRAIDDLVTDAYPESELVAHRDESGRPPEGRPRDRLADRLTARQLEVARAAYYAGFFESPRRVTGEDVAAALDISPSAFYQHVRAIQRKLCGALLGTSPADDATLQ